VPLWSGEPACPRVLIIVHNLPVASEGGRRLTEIGWNDPTGLALRADLADCSYGYRSTRSSRDRR
jgi:hypothetical protein